MGYCEGAGYFYASWRSDASYCFCSSTCDDPNTSTSNKWKRFQLISAAPTASPSTYPSTYATLGPAFNESDVDSWVNVASGQVKLNGIGRSVIWVDNEWPADCSGTIASVNSTKVVLSDDSSFDNPELCDCTEPPTTSPTLAPTTPPTLTPTLLPSTTPTLAPTADDKRRRRRSWWGNQVMELLDTGARDPTEADALNLEASLGD